MLPPPILCTPTGGAAPNISDIFTRAGQTMALGVWPGADTAAAFQTWLGAAVDLVDKHADRSSWGGMVSSITAFGALNASSSQAIVWSVPLVASTATSHDATAMTAAAAGANNSDYTTIATTVLAAHNRATGPIFIRSGWEQNGNWQPWAAQDSTQGARFISAWANLVSSFRAVSSRFKFIWCPNFAQANPDLSWPGAQYVDLIGMDIYYNAGDNAGDGAGWFGYAKGDTYGLDWLVAKGVSAGKPICIPEWGIKACQTANVGEPGPAAETSSQAVVASLMSGWMRDNGVVYSTYWDSNFDIDCKLSSGQYPLTGAGFKTQFGAPAFTSSAAANLTGNGSTGFSRSLTTSIASTFTLSDNADGFSVAGGTLTLPAQTWVSGGDNTRTVTITAKDARGLTATQSLTLTVTQPITDLYPTYDFAFDPVTPFFKIGSDMANTVAGFLALPGVSYSANPTAGFSGSGYYPDETYGLVVTIPSTSALSLYTTAARPPSTSGVYHQLLQVSRSTETSTRVLLCRDGFGTNARLGARNAGVTIGADTNFGSMTSPDSLGVTISGTAVKGFIAGALGTTISTTVFASKPLNCLLIGDGLSGDARWDANITRILGRYSTDSDATAAAMT